MTHDRDEAQFQETRAGVVVLAPACEAAEEAVTPLTLPLVGRVAG